MTDTVLFTWELSEASRRHVLAATSELDLNLVFPEDLSKEAILELAREAAMIIGPRISPELLDAAGRARLFVIPWAGVQHTIKSFQDRPPEQRPPLANAHGNAPLTAQHAAALLLALTNQVIPHHRWMLEGRWRTDDRDAASIPLRDRHLGFLGYGAVNRHVHKLLGGFGLEASALRSRWPEAGSEGSSLTGRYRSDQLLDFLRAVDVLIIALPMTDDTRGLIGAEALDALGPSGLVVQMSRGPIVDEDALFEALSQRRIRGAAIDVWYEYKPEPAADGALRPYSRPFHELDNVVLSPHRAASPFDDLARWSDIIENIRRLASGRPFINLVDVDRGY